VIRRLAGLALLTAMAGPALALSCLPHDVARTHAEAEQAEETYVIVRGILVFDETALPVVDMARQHEAPPNTAIPARLTGQQLTQDGFTLPFDEPITLNARCFGPWCAGARSGIEYLGFLERTGEGYGLTVTPCGGFGFASPSRETLERVQGCVRGGPCAPKSFD
jgi:hypothetical protein